MNAKTGWPEGSRHDRGYGSEWDKLRLEVLERDRYLCQCRHCKSEGRAALATEVDHIVSRAQAKVMGWTKARTEAMTNLQAINEDCHKRKTQEERGRELKTKSVIGLDGWPTR